MHDGPPGAFQSLETAPDQRFARRHQNRYRDIVRYQPLLDQQADKVIIGLGGRRKADGNLLETDPDQELEESRFLLDGQGIDQRLIAVAQILAAPDGRLFDPLVGPLPLRQTDDWIRLVLMMIENRSLCCIHNASSLNYR